MEGAQDCTQQQGALGRLSALAPPWGLIELRKVLGQVTGQTGRSSPGCGCRPVTPALGKQIQKDAWSSPVWLDQ